MGPLFENVVIEPCLLHGDLWSGNVSSDKKGEPVILDPACYCKFNLVQIANTILFLDCLSNALNSFHYMIISEAYRSFKNFEVHMQTRVVYESV